MRDDKMMRKMIQRISIILLLLSGHTSWGQSGIPLYLSTQTGEFTSYSGEAERSTGKYEQGQASLSLQGPIKFSLDPGNIVIGQDEKKQWHGKIYPDLINAPKPGSSDSASLMANFNIEYIKGKVVSLTTGQDKRQGVEVVTKGIAVAKFTVYSVSVKFSQHIYNICEQGIGIKAAVYPAGGEFSWKSLDGAVKLIPSGATGGMNAVPIFDYKNIKGPDRDTVVVKYKISGVNYSDTCIINLPSEIGDVQVVSGNRIKRPGYVPKGKYESPIPESIAKAFHFTPCINSQDSCYGDCNSYRNKCDSALLSCMLTQCRDEPNDSLRKKCTQLSAAMYKTVDEWGSRHYQMAQKEGCINCRKEEEAKDRQDNTK